MGRSEWQRAFFQFQITSCRKKNIENTQFLTLSIHTFPITNKENISVIRNLRQGAWKHCSCNSHISTRETRNFNLWISSKKQSSWKIWWSSVKCRWKHLHEQCRCAVCRFFLRRVEQIRINRFWVTDVKVLIHLPNCSVDRYFSEPKLILRNIISFLKRTFQLMNCNFTSRLKRFIGAVDDLCCHQFISKKADL